MSKYRNDINLAYQNNISYIKDSPQKIIYDYDDEDEDFDIRNMSSIFNYIYKNKIQFLLLLFVGFIIYFVDYINQINSMLFVTNNFLPGMGYIPTNNSINNNSVNNKSLNNISKKKVYKN